LGRATQDYGRQKQVELHWADEQIRAPELGSSNPIFQIAANQCWTSAAAVGDWLERVGGTLFTASAVEIGINGHHGKRRRELERRDLKKARRQTQ
jgi:hypothetical protein